MCDCFPYNFDLDAKVSKRPPEQIEPVYVPMVQNALKMTKKQYITKLKARMDKSDGAYI